MKFIEGLFWALLSILLTPLVEANLSIFVIILLALLIILLAPVLKKIHNCKFTAVNHSLLKKTFLVYS